MATDDQLAAFKRANAAGGKALVSVTQLIPLVVNGNTTVSGSIQIPVGSYIDGVQIETPVAISGAPTSCLVRVGVTAAGQENVADVDGKAQGHIAATIAAALDKVGQAAALAQTIFAQVVTSAGTNSAGTINVLVRYWAPVL